MKETASFTFPLSAESHNPVQGHGGGSRKDRSVLIRKWPDAMEDQRIQSTRCHLHTKWQYLRCGRPSG